MRAIAHWSVDPFYMQVFWDSFWATFILPVKGEFFMDAVFTTPVRDNATAMIFGSWGAVCGAMATIFLVMLLVKLLQFIFGFLSSDQDQARLAKASHFYNRYAIWSAFFFGWGSIGSILPLLAGLFRGNLLLILPLCVIGKVMYYFIFYVQRLM